MGIELTAAAHQRLSDELDSIGVKRLELLALIERARSDGDVSENGDYEAAREALEQLEVRARQVESALRQAVIVSEVTDGTVAPGVRVELVFEGEDTGDWYVFGNLAESRDGFEVISPTSPLGAAVAGKAAGDVVEVTAPAGTFTVTIRKVESAP